MFFAKVVLASIVGWTVGPMMSSIDRLPLRKPLPSLHETEITMLKSWGSAHARYSLLFLDPLRAVGKL